MPSAPPKALEEAYACWLDAQRQAQSLMTAADQPATATDWAEGYRWLTRIASLCQDWILEKESPLHPVIYRSQGPYRKLIVDNPDVDYHFASILPSETYRLHGSRGSAPYLGFTIGTDIFRGAGAGGALGTLGQHYIDQFEVSEDGRFEILMSPQEQPGNWIPLPEGATQLAVRETFLDRTAETPAELHIERIGSPLPLPQANPEEIAEKLRTAARFLLFVVRTCTLMWQGSAANTNVFQGAAGASHVEAQDDEVRTHSDTDMVYMGGRFDLPPGQALQVTIRPPAYDFLYWGLVIVNPWMESYDYRWTRTHTSNRMAEPNSDGSWTLTIAPDDPGVANWLDTGGRRQGFMLLRWVLAGDRPPTPSCQLISQLNKRSRPPS